MAAGDRHPARRSRLVRGYVDAVVRLRWLVVGVLAGGAVAAWLLLPGTEALPSSNLGALLPANTRAERAERASARTFGLPLLPRIAVVQRDPDGLAAATQLRVARDALALDAGRAPGYPQGSIAVPYLNTAGLPPAARERSTTAITYLAFPADASVGDQRDLAQRYARQASTTAAPAHATGFLPGSLEQSDLIRSHLGWVELASILVVALVVGAYLRSAVAPAVVLAAAGIAYALSTRAVVALGSNTGAPVRSESEPILAVLLLGLVTDYSVFMISGVRNRLRQGDDEREAARVAGVRFVPVIVAAGLVVAGTLTTLRVASIGFLQSLGPAMGVVAVVSMLVGVLFTPAASAILGRRLFWPSRREGRDAPVRDTDRPAPLRRRIAATVSRRRVAIVVSLGIGALLMAAASGVLFTRISITPIEALPSGAEAATGARAAGQGFADGIVAPTEVTVRASGVAGRRAALARLEEGIRAQPGVAAVIGAGDVRLPRGSRVFSSADGDAARALVVFRDEPFGARAADDLQRLQGAMPALLSRAGLSGARARFAGDTALARDTRRRMLEDMGWVALAAIAVNLLVIGLFLRAVFGSLVLVGVSILTIGAAIGITTYVFQGLLGEAQLTYYVPLAVGVLLLAFGSDYNVVVVGRIWQEMGVRPVRDAVEAAAPPASRAIGIAGVALAGSFASLAIVPLAPFREVAAAVALGVLIDTFLVRGLLIPAVISAMGRWSCWPADAGTSRVAARAPA